MLVVGVAYAAHRLFARRPELALARVPALYAIGGIAVYWSIGRVVSLVV